MKKIITLIIAITLGGQLHAQTIGPDQLDQIKRMSRKYNHIEKTYTGTVEKLVYGFQSLGGALDGMIFRKSDGRLTFIRFYDWQGKSFKPYLQEGGQAEIIVTGDPILLDVFLYRDDYLRELEFSMREEIFGMGYLKQAKNETGSIGIETMDQDLLRNRFRSKVINVYNAEVRSKSEFSRSEFLICLNNGDSLLMAKNSSSSLDDIPMKLSYVKKVRDTTDPNYYKNPNVYNLYSGKSDQVLLYQYGVFFYNNRLLNIQTVSIEEYLPGNNGIVESAWGRTSDNKRILLHFSSKSGQEVKNLFENKPRTVHLMPLNDSWRILGIEDGNKVNEIERKIVGGLEEEYTNSVSNFEGKITQLFKGTFEGIERCTGAILDDSIYINIPDVTGISIGSDIKVGDGMSVKGYKKLISGKEYRLKEYDIIYPTEILLGRKAYQVKDLFRIRQ